MWPPTSEFDHLASGVHACGLQLVSSITWLQECIDEAHGSAGGQPEIYKFLSA
jgi:hypothetical protein